MKLTYTVLTILLVAFLMGLISPDEYYVSRLYKGERIYDQIQEAINHAKPGAVIVIRPGNYKENLIINKPVKIISLSRKNMHTEQSSVQDSSNSTTIVARNPDKPVIKVMADKVRIIGLHLKGGTHGVSLLKSKGCQIFYNRIEDNSAAGVYIQDGGENKLLSNKLEKNDKGIYLSKSSNNCVKKNQVIDSFSYGIYLKGAGTNSLKNNWIKGGQYGLIIANSPGNLLRKNDIRWKSNGNTYPFRVWGTEESHFMQNIDSTNFINGKPIYYLVEEKNRTIDGSMNPGYIALIKSQNIKLSNLTISHRSEGITVVDSSQIELINNVLAGNGTGIYLWKSAHSIIKSNSIRGDQKHGVYLISSHSNRIEENHISGSSVHALFLDNSSHNEISGNTITGNKQHGVLLKFSHRNRLAENEFIKNETYGILLEGAKGNVLEGNILKDSWVGIMLERSDSNTMIANQIKENKMGIFLNQALGNEIYNNLFQKNERSDIGGDLKGNTIKD